MKKGFIATCMLVFVIAAAQVFAGTASLTWDAPAAGTTPPDHINIYQSTTSGVYPSAPVATIPAPATSYVLTVPDPPVSTTYYFVISGVNGSANPPEGGKSNEVSKVFAPAAPVLPAPSGFTATVGAQTKFAWADVPGAMGYLLRVHKAGTPYSPCDSMAYCNSALIVSSSMSLALPPGDYDAWVHAGTSSTVFGPSSGIAFTVPPAPVPPTGLKVSQATAGGDVVISCTIADCPKGLTTSTAGSTAQVAMRTVKRNP